MLKLRFCIILLATEYSLVTQVKLVYATKALHNFITRIECNDISDYGDKLEDIAIENKELVTVSSVAENSQMQEKWTKIAQNM